MVIHVDPYFKDSPQPLKINPEMRFKPRTSWSWVLRPTTWDRESIQEWMHTNFTLLYSTSTHLEPSCCWCSLWHAATEKEMIKYMPVLSEYSLYNIAYFLSNTSFNRWHCRKIILKAWTTEILEMFRLLHYYYTIAIDILGYCY